MPNLRETPRSRPRTPPRETQSQMRTRGNPQNPQPSGSNYPRPLMSQDTPRQRLARPPSPASRSTPNRDKSFPRRRPTQMTTTEATRPGTNARQERPRIQDSTLAIMKKLNLTPDSIDRIGIHCFQCGAGRSDISNQKFHRLRDCPLPRWDGEPHNCKNRIQLLHHPADCPAPKRVSRIRIED